MASEAITYDKGDMRAIIQAFKAMDAAAVEEAKRNPPPSLNMQRQRLSKQQEAVRFQVLQLSASLQALR